MKRYFGRGSAGRNWYVEVEDLATGKLSRLTHHPHHSPDGHAWGYGGSGPAELAKDLLWDVTGNAPEPAVYQRFKSDVIALLSPDRDFVISENSIITWLAMDRAHYPVTP